MTTNSGDPHAAAGRPRGPAAGPDAVRPAAVDAAGPARPADDTDPADRRVRSLRALIVEDSDDDLQLILRMIRQGGFEPTWEHVQSASALRAVLAANRFDIVIADHSMPSFTGLDALEIVRATDPDVPFLLVSGTMGEEIAGDAMRAGARDYLLKSQLARLAPAIARELAEGHNRRERSRLSEELRQAQKMEAVGRLAGGVAHDFNNMLTAINGYADLLLADLSPADPAYNGVREIRAAGERAATLTRQLLALGRRQALVRQRVDLAELVGSLLPMLARLIGEDIIVEHRPHGAPLTVLAHPGQLQQVILNLVLNARDAMAGGGRLTIETKVVPAEAMAVDPGMTRSAAEYALVAVADNGSGMDAETQGHLFEPFFTTKEPGKGTGLGLATVWSIVHQSGGQIELESEPGQGTTFRIYLPLTDAPVDVQRVAEPAPAAGGRETILLVEDEPLVRSLLEQILRRQGYNVLVAVDPTDAVAIARSPRGRRIDLLVSDVIMPVTNGPALAQGLRESRPDLRVLFVSGYNDDIVMRHGVMESGTAFLQKPFTPDSLARKLREVLDAPVAR